MKEKLIIKNFGPIKNVELELGRFNVLIGENSRGKSMVAKVVASIYSLLESTGGGATSLMRKSQLGSVSHFEKHLSVYKIDSYLKSKTIIRLKGKEIDFNLENETIEFNYQYLLDKNFPFNNITYIPADRIATSLFSAATWPDLVDIEEGRLDMPKYFLRFSSLFGRIKKGKEEFDFTELLGVKFRHENGIDKIILKDGTIISINESASAIQSNLSLCTIMDWQYDKRESRESITTFIIEEPELNLFPTSQNKLLQYLVDKTMNYGSNMLLSTHSPYILTSTNNLLYAYKVGQLYQDEANKIIDKKYWLNPNDFSAYILADGECEDIFDREEGMIKAEKIDEVSRKLNKEFDSLMDIELGVSEEK